MHGRSAVVRLTTMHHCLYISEVLNLIFESVRCWDDQCQRGPQVGKKTLASLARTCHSFSSPALDYLWHDLYSFDPLLNIFPVVRRPSPCLVELR